MQSAGFICRACLLATQVESRTGALKFLRATSTSQISRSPIYLPKSKPYTNSTKPVQTQIDFHTFKPHMLTKSAPYGRPRTQFPTRQQAQRRPFSTSLPNQRATLNPKKDEDGKDMNIEITPRASKRLKEIMASEANPDLALRVQVESGGCHGFQYLMSLTNLSKVDRAEDTVFESEDADSNGVARVVMDEPSLELLKGSKVDYMMELIGSQFKISDNPLATSSCGCGTSFDIKA